MPRAFVAPAAGYTGPAIATAFVPRIPRYDYYEHNQERLGATASFQFKPSDRTLFNLDGLYAKFDAERREVFLEIPNFSAGIANMRVAGRRR